MANEICTVEGCESKAQRKGLCRKHYDAQRQNEQGKTDEQPTESAKEASAAAPMTEKPFIGFTNPYKPNSGYGVLFEVVRTNPPLPAQETIDKTKAVMEKTKPGYRADCAFAVVASKRHRSKRPGYHMKQREDGRWDLIEGDYDK